jgi:hypothetical protein
MADEARLNELLDLVEQARAEGDTATEAKAVAAYRRESAPAAPPAFGPNLAGITPQMMQGQFFANTGGRVADSIGITEANSRNGAAQFAGPLEVAAQAGTGLLGTIAGGLAGTGQSLWNSAVPKSMEGPSGADRVRQIQGAMTYQPRTGAGAGLSNVLGLPGKAITAGSEYLGGKTTDATGSPLLGTAVETIGEILPTLIGARMVNTKAGPKPDGKYVETKYDVPTTEQLTSAAKSAYADAKSSGVVVPAESYSKALTRIQDAIKAEGINSTLHPKTTAVLKQLEESAGKNLSITDAENLRRVIQEVAGDLDPVTRKPTGDAFRASKILDEFDDAIDQLSVNSDARSKWARSRKSQMLDDMIHRAEIRAGAHYTQAGMEHALRQEFKQLAMNPRRMRGLDANQRTAIEKVAKGGPVENTLRALGKFDPTTGGMGTLVSLGTSAIAAPFTGGLSMALPLAGFGGKRAATKMTERNVDAAREALVGRGLNGGLLGAAPAKQPFGAQRGSAGAQAVRSPAELRREIDSLDFEVQRLASMGPVTSTIRASVEAEVARLRRELAAAEAQAGRP